VQVLADQQQVILKGVLEETIDNNDNDATIKAKTFYKSCMDLRKYLLLYSATQYWPLEIEKFPFSQVESSFKALPLIPIPSSSLFLSFIHSTTSTSTSTTTTTTQQHTEQIRKIGDQPLRDKLKLLGGWPVIEDKWKAPVNMSIEKLMGTLRGDYSEPVLIELYVGADDKNSSINILQVSKEARR